MNESENSEQEIHEPAAFGQQLMLARERAGMSIEEAARSLNLKEEMVVALESSDLDKLPPVAFVRGYIRTYTKLLGLPEDSIVDEFETELPRELESELQPRSALPNEADSQTPVIKLISAVIIVSAVSVLIYAVYSYYIERTESIEQDSLVQALPEMPWEQQAPAEPGADATISESLPATTEIVTSETATGVGIRDIEDADDLAGEPVEPSPQAQLEAESESASEVPQSRILSDTEAADTLSDELDDETVVQNTLPIPTVAPITGGDVLTVSAEQESWAEIVDANDIQLFYGMIEPGRDLSLTGQAPFDIFLGNAPVVSLSLNATNIDMTKYIRSNNIAQFKVSVEEGRIQFH